MKEDDNSSLARGGGVALWRQVEDILVKEIVAADTAEPARLPTEGELAARFAVNRHTIRHALSALQEKGLVRIEQGRGTFTIGRRMDYVLGARTRFRENLTRQSVRPSGRLLRHRDLTAEGEIAACLDVRPGTLLGQLDTIRDADDRRICVATHYYPSERFAGMADAFARTLSMTEAFRLHGVSDYRRRLTRITAQLPTVEDARFLHIQRNRPVLVTESVDVDLDDVPIQYGITRFVADQVQLMVDDRDRTE